MTDVVVRVVSGRATVRPRAELWQDVATVPQIAAGVEAVRSCERNGEHWRWEMGRYGAMGLQVTPGFDIDATFVEPDRVDFRAVGEVSEDAAGRGWISFEDRVGGRTHIEVGVVVQVDVPIGRLLAPALNRVMAREIRQVVDGLLTHLA